MIKNIFPFLLFLFISAIGNSQCVSFEKIYSYPGGQVYTTDCQRVSDGGYIFCSSGNGFASGNWQMIVTKTDPSGNLTWKKSFYFPLQILATSICETPDHGYLATCTQFINTGNNWYANLIRLDSIGDTLWTKNFVTATVIKDEIYRIRPTHDGGFIGLGMTSGAGGNELMAVKLDSVCNIQWYYHLVNEWAMPADVIETSDRGFILAANCSNPTTFDYDPLLVKLDSTGQQQWKKAYTTGTNRDHQINCVMETSTGGLIMAGSADRMISPASYRDNLILQTDASGNLTSAQGIGTSQQDLIFSCALDQNGVIYAAGTHSYTRGFLMTVSLTGQVNAEIFGDSTLQERPVLLIRHPSGTITVAENASVSAVSHNCLNQSLCDGTTFCNTDTLTFSTQNVFSIFSSYLPAGTVSTSGLSSSQGTDSLLNISATDTTLCMTVGENEIASANNNAHIFPNPIHNGETISIVSDQTNNHFQLFDLSGRSVFSISDKKGLTEIHLPELSPGVYLFYLEDINGTVSSGKIIMLY